MSLAARRVPGDARPCGSSVRDPNSVSQLITALAWPSFLHRLLCVHGLISTHTHTNTTLSQNSLHCNHTVRHPRCVFINYNWINQLSNTVIW